MRLASACRRCAANGGTGERRRVGKGAQAPRPPSLQFAMPLVGAQLCPPYGIELVECSCTHVLCGCLDARICAALPPPPPWLKSASSSPGGQVGPFLDLFEQVRESGERVVIDGPCLSACTLVLSIVPGERICVTKRAVLGFHAARSVDRRGRFYAEPEASDAVLRPIPARCATGSAGTVASRPACFC